MKYHPEAKRFLKQNRINLNEVPKIKDFLIVGISATSYAVIDAQTLTPIAYRNFEKKIQIASISKVMTCYLTILACKKYQIDIKKYRVRVS
jgi:D-alanyl-D-alanine carboxypeptidase